MPQIPIPAAKSSCLNQNCKHCLPACALELDEEVPVKKGKLFGIQNISNINESIVTQSRQSSVSSSFSGSDRFGPSQGPTAFRKQPSNAQLAAFWTFPELTHAGMGKQPNNPLWKHRTKHTPQVYASVPNLNNYHTPSFWNDNSLLLRILLCSISNLLYIPQRAVCQVTIHHTNKKQGRLHFCDSTFLCIPIWGEQLDGLGGTIYWPWPKTQNFGFLGPLRTSWGRKVPCYCNQQLASSVSM